MVTVYCKTTLSSVHLGKYQLSGAINPDSRSGLCLCTSLMSRHTHLSRSVLCMAGENIIMIVGGANQSDWKFSEDDRKVLGIDYPA